MPRPERNQKQLIYVFCEGESKQAYTCFLKEKFSNVEVIKYPKSKGLFEEANAIFSKDKRYKDKVEVIDEICFFFDVEVDQRNTWDSKLKIIKKIRKMRRNPKIKIRLLMTTSCIEYWLMLHFKKYNPLIETVADKQKVLHELQSKAIGYEKGNFTITSKIAEQYPIAVKNAKQILKDLLCEGLPDII